MSPAFSRSVRSIASTGNSGDGRLERADAEGHVRAQAHLAIEVLLRELLRFLVADQQHEILVTSDDPRALFHAFLRLVVDRLRKLDDLTVGKPLEHALAELLVRSPDIAEIAAAMDEDRPRRHDAFKLLGREIVHSRNIGRPLAVAILEIGHLAQPDGRIAAVADVRKVEDRHRLVVGDIVLQAVMNHVLQFGDQRPDLIPKAFLVLHLAGKAGACGGCRAIFKLGRTFDRILPRIFWISVSGPAGRFINIQSRKLDPQ